MKHLLAISLALSLAACASDTTGTDDGPCVGEKCDQGGDPPVQPPPVDCPADPTEPNEFRLEAPSIPAAGEAIQGSLAPPDEDGDLDYDFYKIELKTDDPIVDPIRPTATIFVEPDKDIHMCAFYETSSFLGAPFGCLDGTVDIGNPDDDDVQVSMCCSGADRETSDGSQKFATVGLDGNLDNGTLYILAISLDDSCVPYEIGFNR